MNRKVKFLTLSLLIVPLCSFKNLNTNENENKSLGIFKDNSILEIQNYYKDLENGIKGEELLTKLQPILKKNQKKLSSSSVKDSNWKYFLLADRNFEKDPLTEEEILKQNWKLDNVVCKPLYEEEFTFIKAEKPGNKINREHVFPKSYGFGDEDGDYAPYAGSDLHNLQMGEAKNNSEGHNNYPYGNIDRSKKFSEIKSLISGKITGYLGLNINNIPVYEPRDVDKGNIARTLFYMAARYHFYEESEPNSPSLILSDIPTDVYTNKKTILADETKNNPCQYGILSDLLEWNIQDPVDDFEIHRNNLVYNAIQNNRNPFIDYPMWADIAFGNSTNGINLEIGPSQIGEDHKIDNPTLPEKPDNPTIPETKEDKKQLLLPFIGAIILLIFLILVLTKVKNKKKHK